MKILPVIAAIATTATTLTGTATTPDDIARKLLLPQCHHATVRYEVLMPSAAEPVAYTVDIYTSAPSDTLSPCDYLIDWSLPRGQKTSTGFSSYHAGNHFRYRDTRLQEYHYADDPTPFSGAKGGVQVNAQFTELLPPFIGQRLLDMASDTTFNSTFNQHSCTLSGTQRMRGYDVLEYSYTFNPVTGLPLSIDMEYNPASISEQSITATFDWDDNAPCVVADEAYLADTYPDVFQRFRTSNFRAENLTGTELPTFTALTPDRKHLSHNRGEQLEGPTAIVFLNSSVASTASTIQTVTDAIATSPANVRVLLVYSNDTPEMLTDGIPTIVNAGSLVRDCGITSYPTILLVDTDATIRDVIIGTSADLDTRLSQALMLLK